MTSGVLGIIGCPMLEDNLVWSLENDPDAKDVAVIRNANMGSLCRKLDERSVPYRVVEEDEALGGGYVPTEGSFNLLIYMLSLGLHAEPEKLKSAVEGLAGRMQPYVDAIGFYLGTCGTYRWDIPAWCERMGYKPAAMFCDGDGNLCDDCVGVNIGGGPRYTELQKRYTGYLYMFPAMATNYDDFTSANDREALEVAKRMTPDMLEMLGIEPGPDGYMRWLLSLGHYEHMLRLDNGIADEHFDRDLEVLRDRTRLDIVDAEPGWATTQPTVDLYARCKSFLDAAHGQRRRPGRIQTGTCQRGSDRREGGTNLAVSSESPGPPTKTCPSRYAPGCLPSPLTPSRRIAKGHSEILQNPTLNNCNSPQ